MRNDASVNVKKYGSGLWSCPWYKFLLLLLLTALWEPWSPASRQRRAQGTWIYPRRDTWPQQRQEQEHRAVTVFCCLAPASALLQLGQNTHPPALPPSKHTGNKHSFQHPWFRCRGKKRPKQLMWHEMLHCKHTFMHLAAAPCPHSCVRCISWGGTTPTSRWGCAVQVLLAPPCVSSATKATRSQQAHPWPWLNV